MPDRTINVNGRDYRWPNRPVVVVCLDGSAFEYIERADESHGCIFCDPSDELVIHRGAGPEHDELSQVPEGLEGGRV